MKYLVVSYSFTGNNALLARGLAEKTGSDSVELREVKKRRIITIVLDVIFGRVPKIQPLEKEFSGYDYIIFVSPIWFGKIATPFRGLLLQNQGTLENYAFVSLSAGANGIAPTVEKELMKYAGTGPRTLVHHLISDLVPYEQRGNRKLLDAYRLKPEDAEALIENTAHAIQNSLV